MNKLTDFGCEEILGMRVAVISRSQAAERVALWAEARSGRYVCVANVHMCMESFDDSGFRSVVNDADLTVPDGLPLVWAQRLLGSRQASQVRGEDLTRDVCALAEERHLRVGIFGGSPELVAQLAAALLKLYPGIQIGYTVSPPFRALTDDENRLYAQGVNDAGIRILLVGLGCPKQERWMARQRDEVAAVMLGVGAAFDFIAGSKRAAPRWMQHFGLEWLFRLGAEPGRLWRRYLKHNPRFIWHLGRQVAYRRLRRSS